MTECKHTWLKAVGLTLGMDYKTKKPRASGQTKQKQFKKRRLLDLFIGLLAKCGAS